MPFCIAVHLASSRSGSAEIPNTGHFASTSSTQVSNHSTLITNHRSCTGLS